MNIEAQKQDILGELIEALDNFKTAARDLEVDEQEIQAMIEIALDESR